MIEAAAKQNKKRRNIKVKEPARRRQSTKRGRVAKPMGQLHPLPKRVARTDEVRIEKACERLAHLPGRIAARFARRLPSHIELDDLIGAGSIGLVLAVKQHVDKPDPDLERLAKQRIRGAILDHLRGADHLTRRQRAAVSAVDRTKRSLREQGENLDDDTVAERLGITVGRVRKIQSQLAAVQINGLDDSEQLSCDDPNPLQETVGREAGHQLRVAVGELPPRLQTILSLYYRDSMTYKEIGDTLEISRSRICQLHTQAIDELRRRMTARAA